MDDREEITKEVDKFYTELYASNLTIEEKEKIIFNTIRNKHVPKILKNEIEKSINELCNNKCTGYDKVTAEIIKAGKDKLIDEITALVNIILVNKEIPNQWHRSATILLFKKGNKRNIQNCRPITLISTLYKIFSKTLTTNIKNYNETQPA